MKTGNITPGGGMSHPREEYPHHRGFTVVSRGFCTEITLFLTETGRKAGITVFNPKVKQA